jgi:hypothetical protein
MPQTHRGSCHCGAIKLETSAPIEQVIACNCSICSRAGWLLAFVPADQVRIEAAADALTDYQFAKKHLHHPFCKTCGMHVFSRGSGPDGQATVAINARCIEGLDVGALNVQHYDGQSV